jgi:hypothetical protein
MKGIPAVIIVLVFLLCGCASQPAPTIDVVSIQASAAAMVSTQHAQTKAAIPTPTLTNTPAPTETPLPSPTATMTLDVTLSPVANNTPKDECDHPLWGGPVAPPDVGKTKATNILIINQTRGSVTFSLFLLKTVMGQCGYVGYTIAKSNSVLLNNVLPNGCYYAHAIVNDPKKPTNLSRGPDCLTGQDKTTYTVTNDQIRLVGP